METSQNRRRFLATFSSASVANVLGSRISSALEAPPETTTIRLLKALPICWAPNTWPTNFCARKAFQMSNMS